VALFINNHIQEKQSHDKRLASKLLIPLLDTMLSGNGISLAKISFIGLNQGPGLFSTLRSILATANALHLAIGMPIIGIDGLCATLIEFYNPYYTHNIVLLDACNNEVYYLISNNGKNTAQGCSSIDILLDNICEQLPEQEIYFIGNAVEKYHNLITIKFSHYAIIPETIPQICSLETIAQLSVEKFKTDQQSYSYLLPLHLKKHPVELL